MLVANLFDELPLVSPIVLVKELVVLEKVTVGFLAVLLQCLADLVERVRPSVLVGREVESLGETGRGTETETETETATETEREKEREREREREKGRKGEKRRQRERERERQKQ